MESVKLPSTLRRIESITFCYCEHLKGVMLPESLEYIGRWCFGMSGLESVALPPRLKKLEPKTFQNCHELRHVEFPDGLETIGE